MNDPTVRDSPVEEAHQSSILVAPQTLKHRGIATKRRWLLVVVSAIFLVASIGGVLAYQFVNRPNSQGPLAAQSEIWEIEDRKLKEAQILISENKLDEAAILLAQINKDYPHYNEVLDLSRTIDAKKAEIAKLNEAKQSSHTAIPDKPVQNSAAQQPTSTFVTSIQIRGDSTCQTSTKEALKLLSQRAPTHYAVVTKYVGIIECTSQGSGMFAYESPTRYLVGDATRNAGTVWYAGTIAHDAGHSQLYHTYAENNPGANVPNDVWTGESAEKTCLEAQYDALVNIGGTQAQLDYIKNVIKTQYYDVPYENRWW